MLFALDICVNKKAPSTNSVHWGLNPSPPLSPPQKYHPFFFFAKPPLKSANYLQKIFEMLSSSVPEHLRWKALFSIQQAYAVLANYIVSQGRLKTLLKVESRRFNFLRNFITSRCFNFLRNFITSPVIFRANYCLTSFIK